MNAACLLMDSIYSLVVSDSGGIGAETDTLGLGFANVKETASGDRMMEARSAGRGGILEMSIGI